MIGATTIMDPEQLKFLLEAALKLLSAYAKELNLIDGGNREEYKTIINWKNHGTF